jgi:hypothetical protein
MKEVPQSIAFLFSSTTHLYHFLSKNSDKISVDSDTLTFTIEILEQKRKFEIQLWQK